MNKSERNLDKVLEGKAPADETTAPLADVARRLKGLMDVEAPEAGRERAMFAAAVGGRQRVTPWRHLAPVVAVASLLAAVFVGGRAAAPGDALYPVRRVLQEVDLAPRLSDRVAHRLALAQAQLAEADALVVERPRRAQVLAANVLKALGAIEELLGDLPADEREVYELAAAELEDKARVTSITAASIIAGRQPGEPEDDRSGPGGGSDDDSRSGSDDSGSDDSGSDDGSDSDGSGSDDSGSDDSGSDDSGSDDSGSDDSGSDDGSDSDGSGSGSDDSESDDGSGSGSDDSESDDDLEADDNSGPNDGLVEDAGSDDLGADD